jgi:hypothetical protein
MPSRFPRNAALAALAGLLACAAQAAPIQLNYTATFTKCSGAGCTSAIATSLWNAISGSFVYDPALSSGWVAPPSGYAPEYYSTNRVHTFSGAQAFSATLTAGSLVAKSTGITPPQSPASAWNGIAPSSGAIAVVNGEPYRSGDRVEFRDQSMTDITGGGLPAGWSPAPSPYSGGVAARLGLVFAYGLMDNALATADIPLDMDAIPVTPTTQAISFGFYWTAPGQGAAQWVDYSGRITSFSSAPYSGGGSTSPGSGTPPATGGSVPEPATGALAGLGLLAAAVTRRRGPCRPLRRLTSATAA